MKKIYMSLFAVSILSCGSVYAQENPFPPHYRYDPNNRFTHLKDWRTVTPVDTNDVVTADSVIDWDKMSKGERKQYMKQVVLPKMKPIMHDFGSKKFADVKCATCHGAGARNGQFKMPNPELPKLPNSRAGFEKLMKDKPQWMEFMGKTVKPSMANLLSMKPFDMQTGKGFGCGNCHTTQE